MLPAPKSLILLALMTIGAVVSAADATAQEVPVLGPAIEKGGSSTVSTQTWANGPGLEIQGGTEAGAFVIARYDTTPRIGDLTASFTVTPTAGASFAYALRGAGGPYARSLLRLERIPGSDALLAATPNGNVACADIGSGDATAISLVVHATIPVTFDVLIDGAPTRCTRLASTVQPPFVGFVVEDAANEGYGGEVLFSEMGIN
jgi:hypothetical protein